MSDADICRKNGWNVGTELEGEEYGSTARIRITAIGEDCMLARAILRDGCDCDERESLWTLSCREWKAIKQEPQ